MTKTLLLLATIKQSSSESASMLDSSRSQQTNKPYVLHLVILMRLLTFPALNCLSSEDWTRIKLSCNQLILCCVSPLVPCVLPQFIYDEKVCWWVSSLCAALFISESNLPWLGWPTPRLSAGGSLWSCSSCTQCTSSSWSEQRRRSPVTIRNWGHVSLA